MKFNDWWRAVNVALEDTGGESLPSFFQGRVWWAKGLTVSEAVERHLENEESSQEERSYYDV
jgi:hypothetical protein